MIARSILPALAVVVVWSSVAHARGFDPMRPWYAEGSLGTVQPGPDGTDFGAGQNYAAHAGYQISRWGDLGLSLARANARSDSRAIETNVTSGGLRGRGFIGLGRWSPYAEVGIRLYFFQIEQRDVLNPVSDHWLRAGGLGGIGVLYSRSTWWGGLGAEVHSAIASVSIEGGDLQTFTTYNLFVGRSLGWQ